jgi:hypothetical protein
MAKKNGEPAPVERNRVNITFSDRDFASLAKKAKEEQLPVTTYARLLILRQLTPASSR